MNKFTCVIVILVALLQGCVEYHPYDMHISGSKQVNAINITRIEEACHRRQQIRFAVVSDSLKRIDYNRMILSLENCIAEFNALLEGINNGEGSAGLLVKDDSLYINVNETVATLQSLLDEIKANPKKLKLSIF